MNVGEMIKIKRKNLNLTQDELAEKIHVTRQTISSWDNYKSLPDVTSLILLSNVYEISLDELIKGDITMIKKLEVKESKEKLNTSFITNMIINVLLLVLVLILSFTGYKNGSVYFLAITIFWVNLFPLSLEAKKYKNLSKKNKK